MGIKRYAVAGLVIAGGVAAAWPFRHTSSQPQALSVSEEERASVWTLPQDVTLQVNPQTGPSPAPELIAPPTAGKLTRPASFNAPPPNEPPLESIPAPPFLPMAYESLLVPVGSNPPLPPPASRNAPLHEPLLPSADEQTTLQRDKPSPLWRRHRIVEGDTLPGLALRYLGDATRAGEIHVANVDRLMNPEILPLGVTLLIPPRIEK